MRQGLSRSAVALLAVLVFVQAGCATKMRDPQVTAPAQARHCEESEVITSAHMAVLPIPVVAFFTPRITFNSPDSAEILAKCGGKQQVNRTVRANYGVCVPTIFLTTVISLGIVGACPQIVSWQADVVE